MSLINNIIYLLHNIFCIIVSGAAFMLCKIPYIGFLFYPFRIFEFFVKEKNNASRLYDAIAKLGPAYIKFAQLLSVRADIVGDEYALILSNLQDKLPESPRKKIEAILREDLGGSYKKIFAEFGDKSIAAASIAQVHKAKLHNGEMVAVKILRPGIRRRFTKDINFLYFVAKIFNLFPKFKRLRIIEIVRMFEDSVRQELNLKLEASFAD